MKTLRAWLVLVLMAGAASAQLSGWDTSGNGMLKGTYYFREIVYLGSSSGPGVLADAASLFGNLTFDGAGGYTSNLTWTDLGAREMNTVTPSGTYSIAASGQGWMTHPLASLPVFAGNPIYGMVNAQGIFVGSSTENPNGFNDLAIAAPLASPSPTVSTFRGSYSFGYLELSGGQPQYAVEATVQMNPDGNGNVGTVPVQAYSGTSGSSRYIQSLTGAKYIFSNGAAKVTFPSSASSTAFFQGDYYLYFSPDGNFVFGGSPYSADMLVGVRTGSGTPNLNGLYYEAGMDEDETNPGSGYAFLSSYYGALSTAGVNDIVGHQRIQNVYFDSPYDFTYSDTFNVGANGTYTSGAMNYVVANGIRIGTGIGPYLGLHVALQAPAMSAGSNAVFLNPAGVVNAGSSAPFTAAVTPGELVTLYGENLAGELAVAAALPFPDTLGDSVRVFVNGKAAALYYASPGQIAAVMPWALSGGVARIQVSHNGVLSNAVTMRIGTTSPGVLTQSQNGIGYGDVVRLDGTISNAGNPVAGGEVVSVYMSGLGAVNPMVSDGAAAPSGVLSQTVSTISAFIGGKAATVQFAGLAPGFAGLYQVNLTVPTGLTAGDNLLEIAGPDGDSAQCVISVGSGAAASDAGPGGNAVPAVRASGMAQRNRVGAAPQFPKRLF
jgi:uncharacterized protein (TIGR03437 family)